MNLKVYLATINMSIKEFSQLIDYAPAYVSRIIYGYKVPGKKLARRIEKMTRGEVKADEISKGVPLRKVKKEPKTKD